MSMRYANQDDVIRHLRIKDGDLAAIDRVVRLESGLADAFDAKVGRSFGVGSVSAETRGYSVGRNGIAVIPEGVISITSVVGDWDITPITDFRMGRSGRDGVAYGISVPDGRLSEVTIVGVFADMDIPDVPHIVQEALTFLTVRQYRRENASPSEQVGPDGQIVPTPHAWDDPMVVAAIDRYLVREVVI